MTADPHRIETLSQLRDVITTPISGMELKVGTTIDRRSRAFIERSPFLVLSTADAAGNVDASPKGDDPGFVVVEDGTTLLIPDRPGNHLAMGLQNLIANPRAGVLFMIPGTNETVRVNGRVSLTRDPELLGKMAARGKPAVLVMRLTVEECFFHCAKAFIRSHLWKPDLWPEKFAISFGELFADLAQAADADREAIVSSVDAMVEQDYCDNL